MPVKKLSPRNAHFLGTKIRNLRKRNHLTMEDLSARCIKLNAEAAPSISYLSMIERGKRVPSDDMLGVIATVFQKDIDWFLDDVAVDDAIVPDKGRAGGIDGIALEPSFLFSPDILQIAIPEMLTQTGVSGRQFAHLLIRAHQEKNLNHFPDLERAAEDVGGKKMPLDVDDLLAIYKQHDLSIRWFDDTPKRSADGAFGSTKSFVRSAFKVPRTVHLNRRLRQHPDRLMYDLAVYLGHTVLHNGDGVKSELVSGSHPSGLREAQDNSLQTSVLDPQDIIYAWRDFECSFFASALLCPKVPFRRLLDQQAYEIDCGAKIGVSRSLAMRRMTAVSPYTHWHYFDAYPPGKLNAVYRGNGIPLPWGNMRLIQDPCQHWAVFRMLNTRSTKSSAQISILDVGGDARIYCCESIQVKDLAGNKQVLCTGIDVNPAINAQGEDALSIARDLQQACVSNGGSAVMSASIKRQLKSIAKILNIAWLERGIEENVRLICPRSSACPRKPACR